VSMVLAEFEHEFEQEQATRLRRRIVWYCGLSAGLGVLAMLLSILSLVRSESAQAMPLWLHIPGFAIYLATTIYALYEWNDARSQLRARSAHLGRVSRYITISTVISAMWGIITLTFNDRLGAPLMVLTQALMLFIGHLPACLLLPWTWRESLKPFYPAVAVTIVGLVLTVVMESFSATKFSFLGAIFAPGLGAVLIPAVFLPGIGVAYWKHSRAVEQFMLRSLSGRYGEMQRELSGAQRIHESLFPERQVKGALQLDFQYCPWRAIGGDYLYAKFLPPLGSDDRGAGQHPDLLVLLLDVTGHGIPAALTVNRLYGELERLIAEHPEISPTDLLRALNRYTYLTLSDHSLFVTAAAFRFCPDAQTVAYANAGHPTALLVRADGTVAELEPTAMVMGVQLDLDVERQYASVTMKPGDKLIAYTDGVIESRDVHGRMYDMDGLRSALDSHRKMKLDAALWQSSANAAACPSLCEHVMKDITKHRFGPPSDDTLVVEVTALMTPATTGESQGNFNRNTTMIFRAPTKQPAASRN
jgi:phosphoserine phosphatase RsbU/P